MASQITLFFDRIPLPSSQEKASGEKDPIEATSAHPYDSSSSWYEALSLPDEFVDSLATQGLASVAFLRWLCATIQGADDARIYKSSSCSEQDLVLPETPLPGRSTIYYARALRSSTVAVPIHPKDARQERLTSRPVGESSNWGGLSIDEVALMALRDRLRCQVSGISKVLAPITTHSCHIIPHRRGHVIYKLVERARTDAKTAASSGLDQLRNLVTLATLFHSAWDANVFCLLPLPNSAMNSRGQALPYGEAPIETQPASVSESALHPEPATRRRPVVSIIRLQPAPVKFSSVTKSLDEGDGPERLRGPSATDDEAPWPAEWAWAYRCASQIAACFGTPALRQELRRFWNDFYVDPRGSSETGSSVTAPSFATLTHDDDEQKPRGPRSSSRHGLAPKRRRQKEIDQAWEEGDEEDPDSFDRCDAWLETISAAGGASAADEEICLPQKRPIDVEEDEGGDGDGPRKKLRREVP